MGQKGRSIVKMDVDELINLLNKSLSDEWLAYYQYWVGAKVVKGTYEGRCYCRAHNLHATEELSHAELLINKNHTTRRNCRFYLPRNGSKLTNCGYDTPGDPYVEVILDQNIKGRTVRNKVYIQ